MSSWVVLPLIAVCAVCAACWQPCTNTSLFLCSFHKAVDAVDGVPCGFPGNDPRRFSRRNAAGRRVEVGVFQRSRHGRPFRPRPAGDHRRGSRSGSASFREGRHQGWRFFTRTNPARAGAGGRFCLQGRGSDDRGSRRRLLFPAPADRGYPGTVELLRRAARMAGRKNDPSCTLVELQGREHGPQDHPPGSPPKRRPRSGVEGFPGRSLDLQAFVLLGRRAREGSAPRLPCWLFSSGHTSATMSMVTMSFFDFASAS